MKNLYLITLLLVFVFGCTEEEPSVDDYTVKTESLCSYSGTITFDIGVDVTSNFNESNILATDLVTSSSCSNLPNGTSESISYTSVSRSSNTFSFSYQGETDILYLISGNTLQPPVSERLTVNSTIISVNYPTAELDPTRDYIIITYQASVKQRTYTVFENKMEKKKSSFLHIID